MDNTDRRSDDPDYTPDDEEVTLCVHCRRPLIPDLYDHTLLQKTPGGQHYWWHTECFNRQYPQEDL